MSPSPSPARQLPLSRLGHLIPPLVEGQALVALVPTTADLAWAGKAAWDIARIAARGGRRVALVDLWIEEPALHQIVGLTPNDGIVDAFEYGVSLSKTAHEVDGVFFIAAGSYTASAGDLYAHPRWRKLQAGFRSEGALLLVFVSAVGLARLSAVADGVIVLAPTGLDAASVAGVEVAAAVERGTPLLGVARDRWMPSPGAIPAAVVAPPHSLPPVAPPPGRRRTATLVLALAAVAVAGWGGWTLLASAGAPEASRAVTPVPAAGPRDTSAAPDSAARATAVTRGDTLPWTIQLAAYASLDKALAHADRLTADAGVAALVTPVPQNRAGTVWYRVLAGGYASRSAAGAGREELWRRAVAPRGTGDLLRAPYSLVPATGQSLEVLRGRGVPVVRWTPADRLLVGGFESRDQAAFAQAVLTRAGVRAALLPRVGITP